MKISGLRKIAGETKSLQGHYSSIYLQLNYDTSDGHAWTDQHCSLGHNSWTQYHDDTIINCGILTEPATMKEIEAMIERAVCEKNA